MKKRFLSLLLISALCLTEAVSVVANPVVSQEQAVDQEQSVSVNGTDSVVNDQTDEVNPEGVLAPSISIKGGIESFNNVFIQDGNAYKVPFSVIPTSENSSASYHIGLFDEGGNPVTGIATVTVENPDSASTLYGTYNFSISESTPVGNYTLRYEVASSETYSTLDIYIKKSIDPSKNSTITIADIDDVVYTGNNVTPVVAVKSTINDVATALVSGVDYTCSVTSSNKKNFGTATVTITGNYKTSDYAGTVTKNFDIVPAEPQITSAVSAGYKSTKVTWNKVTGADGYYVFRKVADGTYANVGKVTGNSTVTFTDNASELVTGNTYYYAVRAYTKSTTNSSEEVLSSYKKAGIATTPIPNAPKLKEVTSASYNKLKLTWEAVDGANGYVIYLQNSNLTYTKVASTTQLTYTLKKGIAFGSYYTYVVKAYTTVGSNNIYSNASNSIRKRATLATPVLLSAKSTAYNRIKIQWKPVSNAQGYYVYRRESGNEDSQWKKVATVKYGDMTYAYDKKAVTGVKYIYSVKAYRKSGSKNVYSALNESGVSAKAVLDKTKLNSVTQSGATVVLSFAKVSGAQGYIIYRKTGTDSYEEIATVKQPKTATASYVDKGVSAGTTYTYYVKAYRVGNGIRSKGKASSKKAITVK